MHEGWYPGVRLEDQVGRSRRRNQGLVVTRGHQHLFGIELSELNLRTILQHTNPTTIIAFRRLISWQWGYKIRSEDQNDAMKAWPWQETSASVRSEFTDQFTAHQSYDHHCLLKIKDCVLATRSDNQVGEYEGIVNSNIIHSIQRVLWMMRTRQLILIMMAVLRWVWYRGITSHCRAAH